MGHTLFQIELFIPSTIEGLNKCLDIVVDLKEKFNLDFDTVFGLNTILVEALENAFIHGNNGIRELKVRVFISVGEKQISIEIEDMGEGFDLDKVPSPILGDHIKEEGGRGIYFIKMLSTSCYTIGRGNIIRINLKR